MCEVVRNFGLRAHLLRVLTRHAQCQCPTHPLVKFLLHDRHQFG
jgi:hypothetical protein